MVVHTIKCSNHCCRVFSVNHRNRFFCDGLVFSQHRDANKTRANQEESEQCSLPAHFEVLDVENSGAKCPKYSKNGETHEDTSSNRTGCGFCGVIRFREVLLVCITEIIVTGAIFADPTFIPLVVKGGQFIHFSGFVPGKGEIVTFCIFCYTLVVNGRIQFQRSEPCSNYCNTAVNDEGEHQSELGSLGVCKFTKQQRHWNSDNIHCEEQIDVQLQTQSEN